MINRRLFIYDFETNGFWNPLNQPIQIAIKIVEKDGSQSDYSNYIKCDRPLSVTIERITGITDSILSEKGIDIKKAFADIDELINVPETLIIGHNILTFDNMFMNHRLQMYGYHQIDRNFCFDTCGHFKGHLLQEKRSIAETFGVYHSRMISRRIKGLEYKLPDACNYYGIKLGADFHNAIADIDYTYNVYKEQVKDYDNLQPINHKRLSIPNKLVLGLK